MVSGGGLGRIVLDNSRYYLLGYYSDSTKWSRNRFLKIEVKMKRPGLRVRARGTHGRHNGLRDIQTHLGTTDYARLRIGVDAPREQADTVDHVLGKFRPSEKSAIDDAIGLAVQGVVVWVREGVEKCMNQYNA